MQDKVQGTVVENPAEKEKAPRKKVLLSFVGMRDPYNDNDKTKDGGYPERASHIML